MAMNRISMNNEASITKMKKTVILISSLAASFCFVKPFFGSFKECIT